MRYRAKIEETRVLYLEFDSEDMEDEDDPDVAAFELAQDMPQNEWDVIDSWVDVEEIE